MTYCDEDVLICTQTSVYVILSFPADVIDLPAQLHASHRPT